MLRLEFVAFKNISAAIFFPHSTNARTAPEVLRRVLRRGGAGVADPAVQRAYPAVQRRSTSGAWPNGAVLVAAAILVLFALGGAAFLELMGISLDAFRIFGGLLLFLLSLEMVFARESGTRTSSSEVAESKRRADISVFPLAFPFIAGPGALATILLWFGPLHLGAQPALFGAYLAAVGAGARDRPGADAARRAADARHGRDGRQRGRPPARGDPRGARRAVRARRAARGLRSQLKPQVRRKARSHTSCPRRSPRRSKRVRSRSAGRGTKRPSLARFSSPGIAPRVSSISSA